MLNNTMRMEEFIDGHSAIMDQYDPRGRVALIVGEWGTWHQVEEGTNPGFLYQQNTLRDAMVAAWNLNLFNNHARRVRGANIAQTVNVLQAMVLTRGQEMILTPTYHVFDMYQVHQLAFQLPRGHVLLFCNAYAHRLDILGRNRRHIHLIHLARRLAGQRFVFRWHIDFRFGRCRRRCRPARSPGPWRSGPSRTPIARSSPSCRRCKRTRAGRSTG